MPVINLARQCFSSERRNVAYPVVSAQGSTPVGGHAGCVEELLGLDSGFVEFLGAVQFDFGVTKLNLIVGHRSSGRIAISLGCFESPTDVGIIECRQKLALAHSGAFVKEHAGDAAGDLGGDGSTLAWSHVPTGIQNPAGPVVGLCALATSTSVFRLR
jgi:hypothetical protein